MILYIPKVIEDARLWQASEAPQHNKGCYGGDERSQRPRSFKGERYRTSFDAPNRPFRSCLRKPKNKNCSPLKLDDENNLQFVLRWLSIYPDGK